MPSRKRPKKFSHPVDKHRSMKAAGAPNSPTRKTIGLPKHLIVDGYNLIHAHPQMKKTLQSLGTDSAREELFKEIAILHDYEGYRLTIVFDGQGQKITVERPTKGLLTLSYVFSPSGISADEVIEGLVAKCVKREDVLVSTADSAIRIFIQANGARWLPNDELWRMVEDANASLRRKIK